LLKKEITQEIKQTNELQTEITNDIRI